MLEEILTGTSRNIPGEIAVNPRKKLEEYINEFLEKSQDQYLEEIPAGGTGGKIVEKTIWLDIDLKVGSASYNKS